MRRGPWESGGHRGSRTHGSEDRTHPAAQLGAQSPGRRLQVRVLVPSVDGPGPPTEGLHGPSPTPPPAPRSPEPGRVLNSGREARGKVCIASVLAAPSAQAEHLRGFLKTSDVESRFLFIHSQDKTQFQRLSDGGFHLRSQRVYRPS